MLTRKLIAKEFYLHRWLIVGSTVAGLAGLAIAAEGQMRFNIGMLTWLTSIIAFGVMLAMLGIANERKEHALQFVLSLPLSPGDYVRIKLFGLFLCYLVPWAILSAGTVALLLVRPNLPDGLLPFALLLSGFMLVNFSVVLCGALHTASEGVMTIVIIVTNMGVTLFIFLVGGVPSLNDHLHAAVPVWNGAFWIVLAAEAATLLVALSLPYFVAARRRDFI
ncbi:ABC transporter permease [Pseudoxanthomonas sp. UTMC 1351]|uniref:ABC transporter permease n=1 Tax=Pseudoxanthomonas sp. UTMC 1351 TaxID=2695853 RepID=UPI0034CFBDC9